MLLRAHRVVVRGTVTAETEIDSNQFITQRAILVMA
jgi:hypothetical protein